MIGKIKYRYPVVRPDLPPVESWLPLVDEIYRNRWFSNFGPVAERLEGALGERYGVHDETCLLACSGTAALSACLIACGVRGHVLMPAFTFPATFGAIKAAGADPLVADVDLDRWTLAPDTVRAALKREHVSAVMLVVPFGIKQDLSEQIELCQSHHVPVIVDNAAGLGVARSPLGNGEGTFEIFSLHATKPFAAGEGGAIFAHRRYREALKAAMSFALTSYAEDDGPTWGFNGKISEFHAAIGTAQLDRFDSLLSTRRRFVDEYLQMLAPRTDLRYPRLSSLAPWQVFPVLFPEPNRVEAAVARAQALGLELRRYYRPSLANWPGARVLDACPIAEALAERMCCFPVYSDADERERSAIVALARKVIDET